MKRIIAVLTTLLVGGALFAACGGDDKEEPVTADTLVATADAICTENNEAFGELGIRGLTNPGIADEFEGTAEVRRDFAADFENLEVDDSVPPEWDEYIELTKDIAASDEAVAKAAGNDDDAALGKAFDAQTALYEKRDELAKQLQFDVCGQAAEIEVTESGTGPADDLALTVPSNTVEEAADTYLESVTSGDCEAINAQRHSDAGTMEPDQCAAAAAALKGGEVVATEQYGPVGVAEVVGAEDVHYATFFATDLDGELKYAGDVINDSGGLRPAIDGNDADATADAAVEALRAGDAKAFNAAVNEVETSIFKQDEDGFDRIGQGDYGKPFVADIRDTDASPEPLGINASYAFYMIPGAKNDWVVNLVHAPGLGNRYRMTGFYPIPKAE